MTRQDAASGEGLTRAELDEIERTSGEMGFLRTVRVCAYARQADAALEDIAGWNCYEPKECSCHDEMQDIARAARLREKE